MAEKDPGSASGWNGRVRCTVKQRQQRGTDYSELLPRKRDCDGALHVRLYRRWVNRLISSEATIAFYDRHAGDLATRYAALHADVVWAPLKDLLPHGLKRLALDVGAGTGRDAAWLAAMGFDVVAVEPAAGMRREGVSRHADLRWVDDRLPDLATVHRLGLAFDVILLGAVWMHLAPRERPRAFRKLITLLRPGGQMLLSLRSGPTEDERAMHPAPLGEIEALARDHGLAVVRAVASGDVAGRADVTWMSVCLRLPDDGSVGLPTIRGIILNDDKSSTYKLGLMRAVAKIADVSSGLAAALPGDQDCVAVPLGLVALNWLRAYLPLIRGDLPQSPGNQGTDRLGFAKEGFRSLLALGVAEQDLRVGAIFTGDRAIAVRDALVEARRTIVAMPVRYTKMPNTTTQVFEVELGRSERGAGVLTITPQMLWSWGRLSMPGPLWRAMQRFGIWIEPVIVAEWTRLMRAYALSQGRELAAGTVEARMAWSEPMRNTDLARTAVNRLVAAGRPVACVWSAAELRAGSVDIDHALPWSAWPCNDLWNLLPAARRVNQREKRDRLPSAAALARARDPIIAWWTDAWNTVPILANRFASEARAALPIIGDADLVSVFAGLEWRRLRVELDQAPPLWTGSG